MSSLKKKGLGRGLDALLGGASPASTQKSAQQSLAIALLKPGKYQPRQAMNGQSLEELADSIRAQGIMQPLLVRPLARSSTGSANYEIIAGERRFRAAQIAGLKEVPVLVRDVDDQAALAMALIENLQREDLTVLEEAQGIDRLIREFGLTHEQAAKAVGRSRSATTNLLRLLQLPAPVQQLLREQTIDAGHARALLPLPAMQQRALAQRIVVEGLSVREAERLVAKSQAMIGSKKSGPKLAPPASRDWMRVQDQISDALGLPVVLKQARGGRGELTIRFSNMDELDGVIALLAPEGLPEA
ncbi:MAG: ParB/RepB/Spo0J family partition protein [Betaproteobacteria bacterium]|nr:ParB/RepB/Spo0J family partition protein [Betaproteobacteria bacterium]